MISQFNLERTEYTDYPLISLSVNYARLDEYLHDVAVMLHGQHYKGKVLFDLIISNGTANRFYEAYFDGTYFDVKSFEIKKDVPICVLEVSNNFYSNNLHLLDDSVLTKPQKFLFKKSLSNKHNLTSASSATSTQPIMGLFFGVLIIELLLKTAVGACALCG